MSDIRAGIMQKKGVLLYGYNSLKRKLNNSTITSSLLCCILLFSVFLTYNVCGTKPEKFKNTHHSSQTPLNLL